MKAIYGSLLCLFILTQVNANATHADSTGKGSRGGKVDYNWKVEGGESASTMSVSNLSERIKLSPRFGFFAGVSFVADDFNTGRLSIGAQYQRAGTKVTIKEIDKGAGKITLHYLRIAAQYHFYIGGSKRLFAGGGGYFSPLLSHQSEQTSFDFENVKKQDAGAIASIGYRLSPRIILEGGVQKGLVNIDVSESRSSARNSMAFLSLNFLLGSAQKSAKLFVRKQGSEQHDY
jgi:Outer membrane protein beta-barrel domain